MHLNKRGNTTKEQEKMQGFLGESVVAVKAAKKKKSPNSRVQQEIQ